jgi:hypothetical protein
VRLEKAELTVRAGKERVVEGKGVCCSGVEIQTGSACELMVSVIMVGRWLGRGGWRKSGSG